MRVPDFEEEEFVWVSRVLLLHCALINERGVWDVCRATSGDAVLECLVVGFDFADLERAVST